ncbi:hypothetical protein Tco_0968947 [Tanacetum coccineum]
MLTEDSDQTQSVSSRQTAHPKDTERNIQLTVKGSYSPPDEGTRKSQPLPEGKTTNPKDSRGNDQPIDKGLPSMVSEEGTSKTKPLPEGTREDKDSKRFKPLAGDEMDEDIQQADEEEIQSPKPSKESSTEIPTKETVSQEHQSPKPNKEKPKSSHARDTDACDSESSSCSDIFKLYDNYMHITQRQLEKHEVAVVSYADLRAFIKDYYEENVDHRA